MTYSNGSSYTFTWNEGKELSSVTHGGVTASYSYNSAGTRTSKTVGGSLTSYKLFGDKVVEMKQTEGTITYSYTFTFDENGNPYFVSKTDTVHSGTTTYRYILSLQGDVIKIVDSSNNAMVNYVYDAYDLVNSRKNFQKNR